MNWPNVALAELVSEQSDFVDGPFGSNLKSSEYVEDGVPIIQLKNIRPNIYLPKDVKYITTAKAAQLSRHNYKPGDLVISKLGAVGTSCIIPEENEGGIVVADVVRFRGDKDKIDHKYLCYFLNSDLGKRHVLALSRGSTRLRTNLTDLKKIEVPLPIVSEQQRIAAILDKADNLRRKRQQAIQLAHEFLRAVFLDMFGDVEGNGWELSKLEDVASEEKGSVRTGPFGSQLLHSEFTEDGVAVLGIDNAVDNTFKWGKARFISEEKYETLSRYTVRPGDVLITIMGTCGRCAIVPDDISTAINTKHLCCITLEHELCLPQFLHSYYLYHPISRDYLQRTTKGAIMDGLNMGIIKEMPFPLVPIDLQYQYKELVSRVNQLKAGMEDGEDLSSDFFGSLSQKAFSGEL